KESSSSAPVSGSPPQEGLYGVCFETGNDADTMDRCTSQIALSVMLYGFDAGMRSHIQEQFTASRVRRLWDGMAASVNAKQYWSRLSIWYFGGRDVCGQSQQQCPSAGPETLRLYDPGGFALLKRVYSGLERPRAIEAIRARSISRQ